MLGCCSTDTLQGDSPLEAGVRILPFIFMIVTFSLLNGALMPKFGYYMPWYLIGSILALIGSALLCKWLLPLRNLKRGLICP